MSRFLPTRGVALGLSAPRCACIFLHSFPGIGVQGLLFCACWFIPGQLRSPETPKAQNFVLAVHLKSRHGESRGQKIDARQERANQHGFGTLSALRHSVLQHFLRYALGRTTALGGLPEWPVNSVGAWIKVRVYSTRPNPLCRSAGGRMSSHTLARMRSRKTGDFGGDLTISAMPSSLRERPFVETGRGRKERESKREDNAGI